MTGTLAWQSNTNTSENSCTLVQCDCITFWEVYQQQSIIRLSNLQDRNTNTYRLEPGYEARARRIASVYAKIYLETEVSGNRLLKGRYYWMGLGAFASKTVAAVFKHGLTRYGYWIPSDKIRNPVHAFAKGNLWLFMDIAPWHYAWSASPVSFNQCKTQRDVSNFTHIKNEVMNLPWSSCLPQIKNLSVTSEINKAFVFLQEIERVFKQGGARQDKFKRAEGPLFKHLMAIAVQEQYNILQEIVWKDSQVQTMAGIQRITKTPDSTLVLSSDYSVRAVKPDRSGKYRGENAEQLASLPEEPYSTPLEGTKVEDYDSRMKWINKAAEKYHDLMRHELGRAFLEQELLIISGWGGSSADFNVGRDSNDGKI
ncbi:hypothetical protein F991_01891 [Acinetobacter sp. CIP-A165]|uniref:DUF2515 family protein n=1 Tax=Acinetobacter sp. CIP-A165 TaxID=40373 RepID=UPI0002D0D951|nr:hypothetical protein [Acinetobacter sp. CIP-A165]ENU30094.1 hypothetical protein F991_01891 [Acinetobacter sp. CIP-A165]